MLQDRPDVEASVATWETRRWSGGPMKTITASLVFDRRYCRASRVPGVK